MSTDFDAAYLNAFSGVYPPVTSRTSALDYREEIGSGYAVVSRVIGKFQTQGGLRLEDAVTQLNLRTTDQRFDNHYTSVYPSAIVSYNLIGSGSRSRSLRRR